MKPLPFKMILETDIEKWRAETLFSKEPETIAWLDDMQAGEVLYDVGANIGIYTLYAASRGVQVVAFEPVLENYVRLVQNIELNGFDSVFPIYGACGCYSGIWHITVPDNEIGASGAQLGGIIMGGRQRIIHEYTLDNIYIFGVEKPDYIKIDVDGCEGEIITGAFALMSSKRLKSMLIEFGNEYNQSFSGYTTDNKYNTMTPHSRERRQREGIKAENVVFNRI